MEKKRHTRKHLAAVGENKRILVLSLAREGKLHDKSFHDEDDIAGNLPDEIFIEVDLGFQGLQKQYDNIYLPHKKPRANASKFTREYSSHIQLLPTICPE